MIFLSHAREDAARAHALLHALTEAGLPCLLDPPLARSEVFWRDRLAQQMADCSLMVMLDSAHADASPWVQQERQAFAGQRCAIAVDGLGAAAVGTEGDGDDPADTEGEAGYGFDDRDDNNNASGAEATRWQASPAAPARHAVALVQRLWPGPARTGAAAVAPPASAAAIAATAATATDRQSLLHQAQREHLARMARPRPSATPAFDADTAWLAQGRIELRRLPGPGRPAWLARQPLSNRLYREFMQATGHAAPPTWARLAFSADALPVTGLTWFEATECAAWFGAVLPTEQEWACAARSGPLNHAYATADGRLCGRQAHFGGAFGSGAPVPADAHAANAAGFWGLCGNTWDWCADAWGARRAIRGGGWMDLPAFCRVAARYRHAPIDRDCCVGLRLAWRGRSDDPLPAPPPGPSP